MCKLGDMVTMKGDVIDINNDNITLTLRSGTVVQVEPVDIASDEWKNIKRNKTLLRKYSELVTDSVCRAYEIDANDIEARAKLAFDTLKSDDLPAQVSLGDFVAMKGIVVAIAENETLTVSLKGGKDIVISSADVY